MTKKIIIIIVVVLSLIILIPSAISTLLSFNKASKDIGSVPSRVLEAGIVRRECEKFKNELDAKYEKAKNIYVQSVVLKVQELSKNAILAKEEINDVNKVALNSIFSENSINTQSETIIATMAKYSVDFAKPDPAIRRGVAEAIIAGRTKFEAAMIEVIDVKLQFKNYMQDNSVYAPTPNGQQIISITEYNGCIPNGDAESFLKKYEVQKTINGKTIEESMENTIL